jgi:site-specific recombinase XerD
MSTKSQGLQLSKEQFGNFRITSKKVSRNPERNDAIWLIIGHQDLRVSQVCSLRLRDIDLDAKHLYIGGNSRPRALCEEEIRAYKSWISKRAEMKLPRKIDTLFVSERRRPMGTTTVNYLINFVAKAAGLDYLSIHPEALRRTVHCIQ